MLWLFWPERRIEVGEGNLVTILSASAAVSVRAVVVRALPSIAKCRVIARSRLFVANLRLAMLPSATLF